MTELAEFRTEAVGGVPIVHCAGEIDLTNVGEFRNALAGAAVRDAVAVVVSLREVTYLDSQGLRVVFEVAEKMARARQGLAVVAVAGTTPRRILELAGAATACTLHASVDDALRYLAKAPNDS